MKNERNVMIFFLATFSLLFFSFLNYSGTMENVGMGASPFGDMGSVGDGIEPVVMPSDGRDLQIITDLVEGKQWDGKFIDWSEYRIKIPNEKKYRAFLTDEKAIFVNFEDSNDFHEFGESDWFYTQNQKPSLSLEGEHDIQFGPKKIKLIIEDQPLIDTIIVFTRRYPEVWPYEKDTSVVKFDVEPGITEYDIYTDDVEMLDIMIIAYETWDYPVYENYMWFHKVDLTHVDEQEFVVDASDPLLEKIETDANEIITDELNFDSIGNSNFIIFDKDDLLNKFNAIGWFETEDEPSPVTKVENYFAFYDSWFTDYSIIQTFATGFPRTKMVDIATNYDYPFTDLEDYVSGQIKSLSFQFEEPFKIPIRDDIRISTFVLDKVNDEHRIMYLAGSSMDIWLFLEDDEMLDTSPEGILFYRDTEECFTCNLKVTGVKFIPGELNRFQISQPTFNGEAFAFPSPEMIKTELVFFKPPITLDSELSYGYLFSPNDLVYHSNCNYFHEQDCLQISFKSEDSIPIGLEAWYDDILSYGEYKIESMDKFGNVKVIEDYQGETFTIRLALLTGSYYSVSNKITWHTIDLFEPDICLDSRYGKIRTTGDEPVYADWWAESKRTGIWDPIHEECIFTSGFIEEGGTPFGWAAGPFGGMYNAVVISLIIIFIAVSFGVVVIRKMTFGGL